MTLLSLILAIIVVGVLLWLTSFIPMDATVRRILQVVVIVVLVLWLLQSFGLLGSLNRVRLN